MKKFYYAFLSLVMFASCSEEEMGGNMPESKPEMIRVSLDVGVAVEEEDESQSAQSSVNPSFNAGGVVSRIAYDKNTNGKFDVIWKSGDLMSLVTDQNDNLNNEEAFTVAASEDGASISGPIAKWEGERVLFAIYPHREDYYKFNKGEFIYKANEQVINVAQAEGSTESLMENSILMARAEGVSIIDGQLVSEGLSFRQVMSFLRFEVANLGKYTLKEVRIVDDGFVEGVQKGLVSVADVFFNEELLPRYRKTYTKRLKADIVGHEKGKNAMINFALIPTNLVDPKLVVCVTDEAGQEYRFTKLLPLGQKFPRNKFQYYPAPLRLGTDDFEKNERLHSISEFDGMTSLPDEEVIVIGATALSSGTPGFSDLKTLVNKAGRDISLSFPDLEKVEGDVLFKEWKNLKEVEMPLVKEIGNMTFQHCPQLTRVYMPALEKAGIWTFDDNDVSKTVEFIAGTNLDITNPLQYGVDGTGSSNNSKCTNKRVILTIGNARLYEGKIDTLQNKITLYGSKDRNGNGYIVHTFKDIKLVSGPQ